MYNVWWVKNDKNFGDLLTPLILEYFDIPYKFTSKDQANILCVGSIARHARDNTVVLGSGMINSRKEKLNPNADWRFVRGPYTRQRVIDCGGTCPEIYGDAAMLLPLICPPKEKEYEIGIVPHFVDYNNVKENYPNYNVINVVNENPLEVAKEISKCKKIISSSLHGIIAAHAYGIPAAWVKFSNNVKGDDVKFYDYFEGVNSSPILSTLDKPKYQTVSYNTYNIKNLFISVKKET